MRVPGVPLGVGVAMGSAVGVLAPGGGDGAPRSGKDAKLFDTLVMVPGKCEPQYI